MNDIWQFQNLGARKILGAFMGWIAR